MLSSPDLFVEEHKNDSYEELVKLKNELIGKINDFERKHSSSENILMSPSPETFYRWNLAVLEKIIPLLDEAFERDYVNDEKAMQKYHDNMSKLLNKENLEDEDKIFIDVKKLNDLLYEVFSEMELFSRGPEEDLLEKEELEFLNKLRAAINKMDIREPFTDNFYDFCYNLTPDEEVLLFDNVLVYAYENWQELLRSESDDITEEYRLSFSCMIMIGKIIIEQMDSLFGFGYFMEDE